MTKCAICHANTAEWNMQYINEDAPTFTLPGSHYRGFTVFKVCDDCKNIEQSISEDTSNKEIGHG